MQVVRVGAFPVARWERALVLSFAAGVIALRVLAIVTHWAVVLALAFLPALLLSIPGRVWIGDDGALFTWLWFRRFVRAHEIREVTSDAHAVKVSLADRSTMTIPAKHPHVLAAALSSIRREKMDAPEELQPTGSGVKEWIARLRLLGMQTVTHRTSALEPDRLWQILEDPSAPSSARAAAAIALERTWGEEGRARVRVAMDSIASPDLRRAIESCVESDDEALEHVLASTLE